MSEAQGFRTFTDFYPFYLGEHRHPTCRRLHFAGTTIAAALLVAALATQHWWLIAVGFVEAYAFAWVGLAFPCNSSKPFEYPPEKT